MPFDLVSPWFIVKGKESDWNYNQISYGIRCISWESCVEELVIIREIRRNLILADRRTWTHRIWNIGSLVLWKHHSIWESEWLIMNCLEPSFKALFTSTWSEWRTEGSGLSQLSISALSGYLLSNEEDQLIQQIIWKLTSEEPDYPPKPPQFVHKTESTQINERTWSL